MHTANDASTQLVTGKIIAKLSLIIQSRFVLFGEMLWPIAMEIRVKQTFIHNGWQQLIPEAYEPETLNSINAV